MIRHSSSRSLALANPALSGERLQRALTPARREGDRVLRLTRFLVLRPAVALVAVLFPRGGLGIDVHVYKCVSLCSSPAFKVKVEAGQRRTEDPQRE